jgi:hypothetical protein
VTDRRQPRRKGQTGTVVNSPYGQELVPLVGKLILNFGALEMQSHLWIDHLSKDDVLVDLALESQFSRRVELIHQFIDREDLDLKVKERAHEAWRAASELSEVRNAVAHNPLIWGWHGAGKGEPDYVGIPVIRKLKGAKDGKIPLIDADGLKRAVDEVVKIAKVIVQLFTEVTPHKPPSTGAPAGPGAGAA